MAKYPDNFCAFILTHGRPDRVITYHTLRNHGYTGPIYLVIDDEDSRAEEYKTIYGDEVLQFSKKEVAKTKNIDTGDNQGTGQIVLYARNACFDLAEELGYEYFIQLDDDYTTIGFRFNEQLEYGWWLVKDLNELFVELLVFYKSVPALTLCISQGGDHLGGGAGQFGKVITLRRKAMNTFICSTKRPFKFFGRINEDVNAYVSLGNRGYLFLTINTVMVTQVTTQQNQSGLTNVYLDLGTYVKSFYSILYAPSCVKIAEMGQTHRRIHHKINWRNAVPKILHQQHQKRQLH